MTLDVKFYNIQDFKITKTIKKAVFATIYLVKNIKNNQDYALKLFQSEDPLNEEEQILFMRESMILQQINHPLIVKSYGINFQSINDSSIYKPSILIEYIPNGTLEDILNLEQAGEAPREWTPTKKYINLLGISEALRHLHKNGIIAQNLNLGNILLDENYYPHLCGFHLSYISSQPLNNSMKFDLPTDEYLAPIFRSPEMIREEQCGPGNDVYAYGIMAYRIITGKQPYSELGRISEFSLYKKIFNGYRLQIPEIVSPELRNLISSCWNEDASKRPSFNEIFVKLSTNILSFGEDLDEDEIRKFISNNTKHEEISSLVQTNDNNYFITEEDEEFHVVIQQTGKGENSISYKVVDKRTNLVMCKKVLQQIEDKKTVKIIQNVLKEFEILHDFNHPCLCKAIGINIAEPVSNKDDEDELTTIALFLEFLDYSLVDLLNTLDNTLKTKNVVEIVHGMRFIHKNKMIHRNLKLENIRMNCTFEAKITDFGLVKIHETSNEDYSFLSQSMSKGLKAMEYMSPEMSEDNNYNFKTDVYSFGILLYYLFVGKLPNQSLKDKLDGKKIKLPKPSSSISKDCIDLISKCVCFKSSERPTFDDILIYIRDKKYLLAADVDHKIVSQRDQQLENLNK